MSLILITFSLDLRIYTVWRNLVLATLGALRWLPLKLANQNVRTGEGRVVECHLGFSTIDTPTSHSPWILIGQMQEKPSESC